MLEDGCVVAASYAALMKHYANQLEPAGFAEVQDLRKIELLSLLILQMLVVFLRKVVIVEYAGQIQLHLHLHFPHVLEEPAIRALLESFYLKEEVPIGLVEMDGLAHSPLLVAGLAKPLIPVAQELCSAELFP